jgi:phage shock protein E
MPRFRHSPVDAVIDVRTKVEFWLGHLPNARCVPVDTLPEGLDALALPRDARILVYCASGGRSAMARQVLEAAGYTKVTDGGGYAAARAEFEE